MLTQVLFALTLLLISSLAVSLLVSYVLRVYDTKRAIKKADRQFAAELQTTLDALYEEFGKSRVSFFPRKAPIK